MRNFKLSENFLDKYCKKQPAWGYGDLSYMTYKRSYARKLPNGKIEEWWQTVARVIEGVFSIQKEHCRSFNLEWNNSKAQKSAQIMYDKIFNFKFTPPGRGLFSMGTEVITKLGSGALNNCAFFSTENLNINFIEPFALVMDFSMLGVGCGFDVKGASKVTIKSPRNATINFVVPDSREGWVECLKLCLEQFQGGPKVEFDYSEIRAAGEPIKTFGGIAPGPEPLKELVKEISNILTPLIDKEITSVAITDLMNVIGKCVVSGNIRRTALIALGSSEDSDYIEMKNPKKFSKELKSHRWSSNNSVFGTVGQDYKHIAELIADNGEPGIIWIENAQTFGRKKDGLDTSDYRAAGVNPCSEQVLENAELCTLCETFPANHESAEEYWETLKYAYMYGKTVTLIPTHHPRTNAVMGRNRRIGTSMSGIQQAIVKFGRNVFFKEFCDKGYQKLKEWDKVYSEWLCIPRSIRVSTVKPSGTVSLLAGAFPGIHYTHAKKYIRNVRFGKNSPYVKALNVAGYITEDDYYDPYSVVVAFPIEEEYFTKGKTDASMLEQLKTAADMQYWWSDNAVSCTITFSEEEKPLIADAISMFENELKAVSMLPLSDHGYIQAPYIDVDDNIPDSKRFSKDGYRLYWTTAEFDAYKKIIDSNTLKKLIKKIDEEGTGEKYCSNDQCEIKIGV